MYKVHIWALNKLSWYYYYYCRVHFCVSVCVCVSLSVTIVNIGHTLAKIKNLSNYICTCKFLHLPSNGVIAKIVLRDLDLLFLRYKICIEKFPHWQETIHVPHGRVKIWIEFFAQRRATTGATCTSNKDSNRDLPRVGERPFFSKVQMITKLFLQICLHLYDTRRRVALVSILAHGDITTLTFTHLCAWKTITCARTLWRTPAF